MPAPDTNTDQVVVTDRAVSGNQPDNTPASGGSSTGGGGGGGPPSGSAGGDLGSTYPNPTVVAIEETSTPQRLAIGSIPAGSVPSRQGTGFKGSSGFQDDGSGNITVTSLTAKTLGISNQGAHTQTPIPGYTTSGTIQLRPDVGANSTITLAGNTTFTDTGWTTGRKHVVIIKNGTGSPITVAWPSWVVVGSALPTSLTAGSSAVVELWSTGTTTAAVVALFVGSSSSAITALTGDVTAAGPGSVAATLAASGVTPGSYTNANLTVDSKGRITAASNGSSSSADVQVFDVMNYGATADGSGGGGGTADSTALTNALAAAITYLGTTSRRAKLRIPAGTYRAQARYTATLPTTAAGLTIEGDGAGSTVIVWDSAAAGNSGFAITLQSAQGAMPNTSQLSIRGMTLVTKASNVDDAFTISMPDAIYTQQPFSYFEDLAFCAYTVGGTLFKSCFNVTNPQFCQWDRIIGNAVAGIIATISGSQSLDGLWVTRCYFVTTNRCLDFQGGATGFQTVVIKDNMFISGAADCIVEAGAGAAGGAGDWVIDNNYILTRGSGSYGLSIGGMAGNMWITDNDFDFTAGEGGCIYLTTGERHKISGNEFAGQGGAEIAIFLANGGNVAGCQIHDNCFSNFAHDITVGANGTDVWTHDNKFTDGSSSNFNRAPVLSDAGFRNFYADIPVTVAGLGTTPSWAPTGARLIVKDATATTFNSIVAGGGANLVPVHSDGTNFRIG